MTIYLAELFQQIKSHVKIAFVEFKPDIMMRMLQGSGKLEEIIFPEIYQTVKKLVNQENNILIGMVKHYSLSTQKCFITDDINLQEEYKDDSKTSSMLKNCNIISKFSLVVTIREENDDIEFSLISHRSPLLPQEIKNYFDDSEIDDSEIDDSEIDDSEIDDSEIDDSEIDIEELDELLNSI
jgi:hypothetical protein